MKFRDVFRMALGNLTRHKARTALTTMGVSVGILTIVTMVSLGDGVRREMRKAFSSVGLETVRLFPVTEDVGAYNLFGEAKRTKLLTSDLARQCQARDHLSGPPGLRRTRHPHPIVERRCPARDLAQWAWVPS